MSLQLRVLASRTCTRGSRPALARLNPTSHPARPIPDLLRTLGWERDEVKAEMLTLEEVAAAARSPADAAAPATAADDGAALTQSSSGGGVMNSMAKGLMASLGFGRANTRRSAGVAPIDTPVPIVAQPSVEGGGGGGGSSNSGGGGGGDGGGGGGRNTLFDAPEVRAFAEASAIGQAAQTHASYGLSNANFSAERASPVQDGALAPVTASTLPYGRSQPLGYLGPSQPAVSTAGHKYKPLTYHGDDAAAALASAARMPKFDS